MIAKLAQWRFAGRLGQLSAPATAPHCNDNHPLRGFGITRKRMPPHGLVCHWRLQRLTGALECVWEEDGTKSVGERSFR
jgi:hypothetical protein